VSVPVDISTRELLIEATEWALENDLIFCTYGRRAYYEAVLRELRPASPGSCAPGEAVREGERA
jgi:hypothetical protein